MVSARSVTRLLKELAHPDVQRRRAAAEALAEADERAVYPLIKALRDENPGVQDAAIRSLITVGSEVVAYMVTPLLRGDSYIRNTAHLILREMGKVVLPFVYPLLDDKDEDIRKFALDLLGEIKEGVSVREVIGLLKDPNPNVRAAAAKTVEMLGSGEAVSELAEMLGDEEWVCFSALEALGSLRAESAADAVAGLLERGSDALRYAAIETLGDIGSEVSARALLKHVSRAGGEERKATVKSLVRMGVIPERAEVADVLLDILKEGDWEEKLVAMRGLSKLKECRAVYQAVDIAGSLEDSSPETEDVLREVKGALLEMDCARQLIEILEEPSVRFRARVIAVELLGELRSREAVPHLVKLLGSNLRDIRRAAVASLGSIDDSEARRTLVGLIHDHDGHVRYAAVTALGEAREKSAFDGLIKLLSGEKYPDVLEAAVKALLSIDPGGLFARIEQLGSGVRRILGKLSDNADMLLKLSDDENAEVKVSALRGLSRVSDKRAFKRLAEAARDADPGVRRVAVMALGELDHCHDAIKSLLVDADMWVRMHAVEALGRCFTQDIVRTLRPMLKDRDVPVVLAAIEAISRAGGKEAFASLNALRNHADETVRNRALRALENL